MTIVKFNKHIILVLVLYLKVLKMGTGGKRLKTAPFFFKDKIFMLKHFASYRIYLKVMCLSINYM
jgi:hypothetical protein